MREFAPPTLTQECRAASRPVLDAELRVAPVREAQREPEALETCQQAQDGLALPRALAAAAV